MDNKSLINFENEFSFTPKEASILLGFAYTSYMEFRRGAQSIPKYLGFSIEAHSQLPKRKARSLYLKRSKRPEEYSDHYSFIEKLIAVFPGDPVDCGSGIGSVYTTFNEWKNGSRKSPKYISYSIDAHLELSARSRDKLFKGRVDELCIAA